MLRLILLNTDFLTGQPQMIKVVHATATKGVPVSMASGAVRAVLRSNVSTTLTCYLQIF